MNAMVENDPVGVNWKAQGLCSPLCFATWDHRPLRRAHWPSASTPPLADTPLPCQVNSERLMSKCKEVYDKRSSFILL